MKKQFEPRDFFYNNGLVAMTVLMDKHLPAYEYELTSGQLLIEVDKEEEEAYDELLITMIEKFNVIYQTNNQRIYYDERRERFTNSFKYDVKQKASGNDVRYSYTTKKVSDLVEEPNELLEKLYAFLGEEKGLPTDLKFLEDKKMSEKKKMSKDVNILVSRKQMATNLAQYLRGDGTMTYDSKIHQFEDGKPYFEDLLDHARTIDPWDAMIYWFGNRVGYYYYNDGEFTAMPNSPNLEALKLFKVFLGIPDEPVKLRDEKTGEDVARRYNIPFERVAQAWGYKGWNYGYCIDESAFLLKLLTYMSEELDAIDRTKEEELYRGLWEAIPQIEIVTFVKEGDFKSSLKNFTRSYRMLALFDAFDLDEKRDFLRTYMGISRCYDTPKNRAIEKGFVQGFLALRQLQAYYNEASYVLLRRGDIPPFADALERFEKAYLRHTGRDELLSTHETAKNIGKMIGNFAGNVEDKNLLFLLRNIKNHDQFVSFFKTVEFTALKAGSDGGYLGRLMDELAGVLESLEVEPGKWELYRDYIAIYAVDQYKRVAYSKQKKEA